MPRSGARTHRLSAARPAGVSAGTLGVVMAWIGGLAIARLTGATPVVILLAASLVWFTAALFAGYIALRNVVVGQLSMPPLSTATEAFPIGLELHSGAPVWVELRADAEVISSGWSGDGEFAGTAVIAGRGRVDDIEVRVRSAGVTGMVWWRRRVRVPVLDHVVAPLRQPGNARVTLASLHAGGEFAGRPGAIAGEIDGVRPWREGDGDKSVHWSSTLRSGELVVHDRRHDAERRVEVRALSATADPDAEAGRARWAIEQGLRAGAEVVARVDDSEPVAIPDAGTAARWTALVDLGAGARSKQGRRRYPAEPETSARAAARWWAAGATLVSLLTLSGALGYGLLTTAVISLATIAGAAVSVRSLVSGEPVPQFVRLLVGVGALLAFLLVAAGVGPLSGLLEMLRGPLPQVLVILVLLHGFECRDRRTIRVGLGISGVVLAYAAGFRVDDAIGWWLAVWGVCCGVSMSQLARPTDRGPAPSGTRRTDPGVWAPRAGAVALGSVATIALLVIVPVPDGPARLTLPTFISDVRDVSVPGAIAAPDGEIRDGDSGDGTRARRTARPGDTPASPTRWTRRFAGN